MNFIFVKKSFLAVLALFCFCSSKAQFDLSEREYIHRLANEVEEMFEFFSDHVSRFIDASDHTPYRVLVMGMSDKLDEFQSYVLPALGTQILEAGDLGSVPYHQCLLVVREILVEFLTKINLLRDILVKPEYLNAGAKDGLKAIKLGKELEKYCKDLLDGKVITQLEIKIDKLLNLVSSAADQSLSDRLKEIKTVLKTFRGASIDKKSGSDLKIVNGITAKIRHNK